VKRQFPHFYTTGVADLSPGLPQRNAGYPGKIVRKSHYPNRGSVHAWGTCGHGHNTFGVEESLVIYHPGWPPFLYGNPGLKYVTPIGVSEKIHRDPLVP
jgi:hypothetical protein